MKKLIALLLAVVMVLGLAACATKTETPATDTPATDTPAASTETETKTETKEETPAEETDAEFNPADYQEAYQAVYDFDTLLRGGEVPYWTLLDAPLMYKGGEGEHDPAYYQDILDRVSTTFGN